MDMDPKLRHRLPELEKMQFEKVQEVDISNNLHVYNINYYERELDHIEFLNEGEIMVGTIRIKR